MEKLERNFRKLGFRLRWLGMSEQARYSYLWRRTQEGRQVACLNAEGPYPYAGC